MIGEVITRCLILVFGFAYPAFQCFKTLEKSKVDNQELKFWCQYWIIVAMLTVVEKVADVAFVWLPVYDELKLGFIIYLWHSKTKGTRHIYETILKPYVNGHETDIEVKLQIFRARVWDVAVYYWQNCTQLGQTAMFQVLDYLSGQSAKFSSSRIEEQDQAKKYRPSAPPLLYTGEFPSISSRGQEREAKRRSLGREAGNWAFSESPKRPFLTEKKGASKEEPHTHCTTPETDCWDVKSRHRKLWFFRRS